MSESQIFKAAVRLAAEQRAAYLDQACGTDRTCRSVGKLAIGWLEGNRVVDKQ